jgi:hypothetical protein
MSHYLHNESMAARQLLAALAEAGEDAEEVIDLAIASETNLKEAVEQAVLANAMDQAHCDAIAALQVTLAGRMARKSQRIERRKGAIMAAMELAGVQKLELASATVSVGKGKPAVIITNEAALPPGYVRTKTTVTPDKVAILKALQQLEDVPGAVLSNAIPILTVRKS